MILSSMNLPSTLVLMLPTCDLLALHYVPSEFQLADFFTKAQTKAQHSYFLSKSSVVDPP